MKIVDVAEFYSEFGGGVRTYIAQKLAAGARAGHEIVVVAPGPEDREEALPDGRVRWVHGPSEVLDHRYHRFGNASPVHAILDAEKPDVVEASSPWRGAQIVASWRNDAIKGLVLHSDPVAVYAHSLLDRFIAPQRLDRLCLSYWRHLARLRSSFDTCVVAGAWLARRLQEFSVAATPIPFGVDKGLFSPTLRDEAQRARMLKACGLKDPAAFLFIAVSRHHPEKRLSVLIDAMSRIRHRAEAGLYLVGDGPFRGWTERIAAQVDGVHVAGHVPHIQMPRLLASADGLVHAGAAETFGLTIAEAMCAGLPMVLPDRGGAAALADPAYAETYASGDARACADAALRLMERDRRALAAAAARAAERVQTDRDHFGRLFAHYQSIRSAEILSARAA